MSINTHASSRFSIFDIPLILDLICDNLTKDDLFPCLQVSRDWFSSFLPQVLRRVEFANLKKHQTWTILDSAARIWSLTIDISDAGCFLDNPISPCTNLRELHCVDYDYLPKQLQGYNLRGCPTIVDQTKNALLLVATNPKLHTLTVNHREGKYRDDHITEPVLESLVSHKSLARIHLSIPALRSDVRFKLYNNLPIGLRDLELCYDTTDTTDFAWSPTAESWDPLPELSTIVLPVLERLCLRGSSQRVTSHFKDDGAYVSPRYSFRNSRRHSYEDYEDYDYYEDQEYYRVHYYDREATTLIQRSPRLRDLVLRDHFSKLNELMQLLVISCLDLETIDLYVRAAISHYGENTDATQMDPMPTGSHFAKLREFRIEGELSPSVYQAIAELVSRSTATLEVAWLIATYNCYRWQPINDTVNSSHTNNETSWDRCTRLKELVLQDRGFSTSEFCCDIPYNQCRTALGAAVVEASSTTTVFDRLERLKLAVRVPCSPNHHDYSSIRYRNETPMFPRWGTRRSCNTTVSERRKEWEHRLAFVLWARELYGRIKNFKRLRTLEIEWYGGSTISEMTLEDALQLFYETEFDEDVAKGINFKRREDLTRTDKGWWGPITKADLSWLGLLWQTQAEQEAEAETQRLALLVAEQSSVEFDTSYAHLADPFQRRVGRIWEDWMYLVGSCPHYMTDRTHDRRWHRCCCQYNYDGDYCGVDPFDGWGPMEEDQIVVSREINSVCSGMFTADLARWKSRKANRGRF